VLWKGGGIVKIWAVVTVVNAGCFASLFVALNEWVIKALQSINVAHHPRWSMNKSEEVPEEFLCNLTYLVNVAGIVQQLLFKELQSHGQ
jgi:hypothetical protein